MEKLTDAEIISIDEAIRHCYEVYHEREDMCKECRDEHRQLAKWLEELKESRETINRQKAEIERYKGVIKILENDVKTAKSDAVKEYKEKVKEVLLGKSIFPVLVKNALNEAEKEMIEREDLK